MQTTVRRRLHTARANRKQVNGLRQSRHREVRETRWKARSTDCTEATLCKEGSDGLRSLVMAVGYQGALIWPGQNRGNIQTEDVGELYRRERPKAV